MFLEVASNVKRRAPCVYLSNKLNDFDEYVERHVSRYHTTRSLWEKRCYDGVQSTVNTEKMYVTD